MAPAPETTVAEHPARGIVARRSGDAAAGMRAGAAQIKAFERHSVIRRADHRPRAEQLIEPHLAVEDVAADQPEAPFEIERRMDLPAKHRLGETGRVRV